MSEHSRPKISRCRACQKPVIWATTEKGKTAIYDAEPDPELERGFILTIRLRNGVVQTDTRGAPVIDAKFVARDPLFNDGVRLRTDHHATCPHADQFKKKSKKGRKE